MLNHSTLKTLIFCLLILRGGALSVQAQAQHSDILADYIREGLGSNAALKTQQFDLEKSYIALEEAKTLFMPRVNFQMQYSLAAGGRNIQFPIGDLLNPAYTALNKLTNSNQFPSLENQSINFLPNNFHETKLHTVYPILNKEIFYNREIKKELITVEQAKINVYKRELVKNIKLAYIQYLQANHAVGIYKNALGLVRENLRVNEKLVKNDVATQANVLKAKAELAKVENSIMEAENATKNTAAYFNFLLNKPFDSKIDVDTVLMKPLPNLLPNSLPNSIHSKASIQAQREEFAQIQGAEKAVSLQKKMNESYKSPKLGVALDLGFQGFGFKLWEQTYGLLGLQLDVPLYTAKVEKLKVQQNDIELKKLQAQTEEVLQQIQLQIRVSRTNLETSREAFKMNDAELTATKEYYRLIERRFREGQALQIEVVDARTQMTTTELKRSLAQFAVLTREVELERAEAGYKF
jgi:outer membrane protein